MPEHPNVELSRRAYDAFGKGDMATLSELLADDVVWHIKATGPLNGDYRGRDAVLRFFASLAEETAGTFRVDVHDVLANDQHVATLLTQHASRGERSASFPAVHVTHVKDGQIAEFWAATADPEVTLSLWR
ncbi:MAG: nuclear transport factor 2 family protein [Pseudarthrobacter sp.]